MIRKKVMSRASTSSLSSLFRPKSSLHNPLSGRPSDSPSEATLFNTFEARYSTGHLNSRYPVNTGIQSNSDNNAKLPLDFSSLSLGNQFWQKPRLTAANVNNELMNNAHCSHRYFCAASVHDNRNLRTNGRRTYLIDTLALVRKLEKNGLTAEQAEVITETITQILSESMDNISRAFVSKPDLQMMEMTAESSLSKLKTEILNAHEMNIGSMQREVERIKTDIEKLRSELRYEIDKVTAGQRLDLNLERGRIREELSNQNQQTINLTGKLDREINNLRTDLEAAKFDVIKYCVGTLVSVSAVALGLLRILM